MVMPQSALLDDLRQRGLVLACAVEPRICDGAGNGLFATRALAQGDVVLQVREGAMITRAMCEGVLARASGAVGDDVTSSSSSSSGSGDEALAVSPRAGEAPSENALFCIYLMVQRGRGTDRYVAQLPQENICHLDFATDRELAVLQSPVRIRKVTKRRGRLRALYNEILAITRQRLPAADRAHVTISNFLWAYGIIDSRAFSTSTGGGSYALIPYCDLFNHAGDGIHDFGCDTVDGKGVFYFKAPKAIAAGEEVHLRYNTWMGGYQFAKHYGFIPTLHGEYDRYPMPYVPEEERRKEAEKEAQAKKEKGEEGRPEKKSEQLRRLAANLGIDLDEPEAEKEDEDACTEEARRTARERLLEVNDCVAGGVQAGGLIEAPVVKRMRILSLSNDWDGIERAVNGLFVSADNETCAYVNLLNTVRGLLGHYDTTIAEDMQVLAEHPLPPAARLCLMIRISDKKILTAAYSRTKKFLRAMAMSSYNGSPPPVAETPILPRPAHTYIDIDRVYHATQHAASMGNEGSSKATNAP